MNRRIQTATLAAVLAGLIGLAMLPYGSVAPWAQALVIAGALAIALLMAAATPTLTPPTRPRALAIPALLALLGVWLGFHYFYVLRQPAARTALKLALSWWFAVGATIWTARKLCSSHRAISTLFVGIGIVGTLQAAIGLLGLNMELGRYSVFVSGGRAAGTFSSGNSFGGFIVLAFVATLGLAAAVLPRIFKHVKERGGRLLHSSSRGDYQVFFGLAILTALVLMMLALILSGSRGAGVAGAIALLATFIWLYAARESASSLRRMSLLFLCLLLAVAALGIGGAYAVAGRRYSKLSDAADASLPRTEIWQGTVRMIANTPLGIGLGSFAARYPEYQPQGFNLSRVRHAHNDYLELLAELGVPGACILFLIIVLLLTKAGKHLLKEPHGRSIWLQRCAFLAVIAGLIHAAVDFNISSRPAITILFAALLGAAISRPGKSTHRRHTSHDRTTGHMRPESRSLKPKILILGVCSAALTPLLILQTQHALSSFLMETSSPPLERSQSIYFWLRVKAPNPEQARRRLKKAATIFPSNPRVHVALAEAELNEHRRRRSHLAKQLVARTPGLTKAIADHHITLALRHEEADVLARTKEHLDQAVRLAPADVDANAHLARTLGGLTQLSHDRETYESRIRALLRQLDKARQLAPNDESVCQKLFRGAFRAYCSPYTKRNQPQQLELEKRLLDLGQHIMSLSASRISTVLIAWKTVGIEPSAVLSSGDLPLDVMWKIYQHYNRAGNGPIALSALKALATAGTESATHRVRFRKKRQQAQRDYYARLAFLEECRWLLRTRAFSSYTAHRPGRDAALQYYATRKLANTENASARGTRTHLLALERIWNERGLDPGHMREYLQLAGQHGVNRSQCAAIASPLALFSDSAPMLEELKDFATSQVYAHRLTLYDAGRSIDRGLFSEAGTALFELLEEQPADPDIHATIVEHIPQLGLEPVQRHDVLRRWTTISPDYFIGMQFMGGRCELTGLSVDPTELETFWRFRSPVPSDLQVVILFRDTKKKTLFSRALDFSKVCGLSFGSGNPAPGALFPIKVSLPTKRVNQANQLIVGLRRKSTGRWLHGSEGLPYCEIYDWFDLVYTRHSFRDQVAPSPGIRAAFGISPREYRRPHFSHNLLRIYDASEYQPQLAGERKTTQPPTWQPCLASAGLVERAVAAARKAFDADPYRHMFALGINDGQDWCECGECRALCPPDQQALPASQRWWSQPYWSFVNDVAAKVYETHPEKRIGAIAYSNVVEPPDFPLASNVTVYVCQDVAAHFDPAERQRDRNRLRRWTEVCSDVGLYTYAGLASWIFPRYCRDELAGSMRYATGLGVNRFYIEDSWVEWIDGPLPWIVKKLLEDPTRDPKALQRQFCDTAYGLAADAMDAYFDLLQKVWQSAPRGKWFDGLYQIEEQAQRYPPSVRREMNEFIEDAKELAMGNQAILRRIAAVSEPLIVAEAFAAEYGLIQQLQAPMRSNADLRLKEKLLPELRDAISKRNTLLGTLDQHAWGPSMKKALAASSLEPTIDRWNGKQHVLIQDVENEIEVIRNVLAGVPHPAGVDRKETGETP